MLKRNLLQIFLESLMGCFWSIEAWGKQVEGFCLVFTHLKGHMDYICLVS